MNKMVMFLVLRHDVALESDKWTAVAAFDTQHDANLWVAARPKTTDYKVRVAQAQVGFGYPMRECEPMDLYYMEVLGCYVLRAALKAFQPQGAQWLHDCHKSVSVPVKFTYKE